MRQKILYGSTGAVTTANSRPGFVSHDVYSHSQQIGNYSNQTISPDVSFSKQLIIDPFYRYEVVRDTLPQG